MANMHSQVLDFMREMNQVVGEEIGFRDELLRIRLITEEANETAQAIYGHDMAKAVDGLCDIMYVTLGTFIAFGFNAQQVATFFTEVHESNMAKLGGGLDAFGKVTKPEGWQPPDIQSLLDDMQSEYFVEAEVAGMSLVSEPMEFDDCQTYLTSIHENYPAAVCSVQRRLKQKGRQ